MIVVSGPSGVGKSTVVRRLLRQNKNITLSISATTRSPRPGESDGQQYYFVLPEEFDKMVKAGDFLEWAKVHGSCYGTPLKAVKSALSQGCDVVCEVDVQGAEAIKKIVEARKLIVTTVFVFLIPPSVDILAFRLKKRKTENAQVVNYRLRAAIDELQVMEKYDYIVVNDRVESAAEKIKAIINVEKERMLINWTN